VNDFAAKSRAIDATVLAPTDGKTCKWAAITIGGAIDFVGTKEKIALGHQYKVRVRGFML